MCVIPQIVYSSIDQIPDLYYSLFTLKMYQFRILYYSISNSKLLTKYLQILQKW